MLIVPRDCVRDMFELISEVESMQVRQMFPKFRTPHQCYIVIKGASSFLARQEPIIIPQSFIQRNRIVPADRRDGRRIKDEAVFQVNF